MGDNEIDPETEAMLAGAEVEKGADEERAVQHTVRTQPADADEHNKAELTTDAAAQQDDSVINPESS